MTAAVRVKIKKGIYFIYIGVFWILVTALCYNTCSVEVDFILFLICLLPGILLLVMPFLKQVDIEGIERVKDITLSWYPIVIFFFILAWMPLLIQLFLQDNNAYVDIVLLVGSVFIGISLHFFETGNTILTVAFSSPENLIKSKLNKISKLMTQSALFCLFGGTILLFCGVVFRYDLSSLGTVFSLYMFQRMLTVFGDSAFLWGILQAASLSRWYKIEEEYRDEI